MSKIDYQVLREAAERAIPAMERLLMLPVDDDLLTEQELKDYGVDIDALNAFKFLTGPETVLALLDELDSANGYATHTRLKNGITTDWLSLRGSGQTEPGSTWPNWNPSRLITA